MKISQIIQETTTTAGSVAPVEHGFVKMQTRNPSVYGVNKVGNLLKGKKTNKAFANSVNESAEISETDLSEQDLIVVPGQGRSKKTGFVPNDSKGNIVDKDLSSIDPDDHGDMEGSFVKNQIHTMLRVLNHLENAIGDDEDLPEWVQMKISQAQQSVVGVMDYMISDKEREVERQTGRDSLMKENNSQRVDSLVTDTEAVMKKFKMDATQALQALKIVLGEREYNDRPGYYNSFIRQIISRSKQQGVAEGEGNKYGSQENWDSLRKDIRSQYPYKKGTTVTVPHKGKLVNGKIVRYEAGGGGYSPAYVVDIGEYESIMVEPNKVRRGVAEGKRNFKCVCKTHGTMQCPVHTPKDIDVLEGAKVDRMVKHVAKSEKKLGHSKKEAENIAWATANKRGMLDNKNKKK